MTRPIPSREIQLAGLQPDQLIAAELLLVPASAALKGPWLVSKLIDGVRGYAWARPDRELLNGFMRLARPQAQATDCVAFASAWGMLGMCRHGLPAHSQYREGRGGNYLRWCVPTGGFGSIERRERIADWHATARFLAAVLNLAVALHQDRPGSDEDWKIALPRVLGSARNAPGHVPTEKKDLAHLVNLLMVQAHVGLSLVWDEKAQRVELGGNGLYGALVARLALTVARAEGFFTCAACDTPWLRRERASTKPHTFCPDCGVDGKRGRWRVNKAEYRRLQERARKMHMDGAHPRAIADELGRKEKAVRAWLGLPKLALPFREDS